MKTLLFIVIFSLLSLTLASLAQGTRADYERANALRERVTGKVFRASVQPNWIGDGSRFWYRNDLPAGRREFLLVDPATASKRPAFDHARLAAALTKRLGKPVAADKLPVERIAFEPDRPILRVQVEDKTFACNLQTYELQEEDHPLGQVTRLAPEDAPTASRSGGEETTLTFINRSDQDVALFWLDTEGQRHEYGTIQPGARRTQHTYAGHAWLVTGKDDKLLGAFVATKVPM